MINVDILDWIWFLYNSFVLIKGRNLELGISYFFEIEASDLWSIKPATETDFLWKLEEFSLNWTKGTWGEIAWSLIWFLEIWRELFKSLIESEALLLWWFAENSMPN